MSSVASDGQAGAEGAHGISSVCEAVVDEEEGSQPEDEEGADEGGVDAAERH